MARTNKTMPIDGNGRICIPIEFRKAMGLKNEDLLCVYMEDGKLVMEKAFVQCPYCGTTDNVHRFYDQDGNFIFKDIINADDLIISRKKDPNEHHICASCLQKLKNL